MIDSGKETAEFGFDDKHGLRKMARALSSEIRLTILETLQSGSRSIGELSEELQIPMSTVSTSVSILEESGLIIAKNKPQERGMLKLCSPSVSQVIFNLNNSGSVETDETPQSLTMNMPIGCYTDAQNITPTCGMCNEYSIIGEKDNPLCFFHPDRFLAQRVWFHSGFLEYRFSFAFMYDITLKWLEISFETCSEAPMYRDPWKSDISVKIGVAEDAVHLGGVNLFGDKFGNYAQPLVLKLGYQLDK